MRSQTLNMLRILQVYCYGKFRFVSLRNPLCVLFVCVWIRVLISFHDSINRKRPSLISSLYDGKRI